MASNFSSDNQTLGRGEIHFSTFLIGTKTPSGFRYVGNTPSFGISIRTQTLDHYSSDRGIKIKDKSVPLQTDYSATLTMDDIQPENLALLFLGNSETVTQAPATATAETITSVLPGLSYQLGLSDANPAGVRNLANVKLSIPGTISSGITNPLSLGTDYTVDTTRGIVTFLTSSKAVTSGATVAVTYDVTTYKEDRVISGTQSLVGALKFLAYNPQGDQIDYYMPYVRISPTGDFALKADTWQQMSFTTDILVQSDRAAIYANGTPYSAS